MSYLGVTYVHDKDENFKEFLGKLPISPERTEQWLKSKPTSKLEKDGDSYISTITVPSGELKVLKFKSGEEFDEQLAEGVTPKSTITVDGDIATHVQKFPDGNSITYKREYKGKELVVYITFGGWDGVAKRYYVAE